MFSPALSKTFSRARRLSLAALVGLLTTCAASAEASAAPTDAVIAGASGTAIDTTSGSATAPARSSGPWVPASRPSASSGHSTAKSSGNALTLNPSVPVTAGSSRPTVTKAPGSSLLDTTRFEAPIVGSPGRRQTNPASLAQIQSSGPIVASSGTASVTRHAGHRSIRQPSPVWFMTAYRRHAAKPPAPVSATVEINVPGVHFFISQTSVRKPSSPGRSTPANPAVVRQIGSPGTGLAGLLSSDPRPGPTPGGPANTSLFGNASGPAGGTALLGIDALFTVAILLVGAAWCRRSWDLPVLPGQSALLAMALDRPG